MHIPEHVHSHTHTHTQTQCTHGCNPSQMVSDIHVLSPFTIDNQGWSFFAYNMMICLSPYLFLQPIEQLGAYIVFTSFVIVVLSWICNHMH